MPGQGAMTMAKHEMSLSTQALMKEMDRMQNVDFGKMSRLLQEREIVEMPEKVEKMRNQIAPSVMKKVVKEQQQDLYRELERRLAKFLENRNVASLAGQYVEMEEEVLFCDNPLILKDANLCEEFCKWFNLELADLAEEIWAVMLAAMRMRQRALAQAVKKEDVKAQLNWTIYRYADALEKIAFNMPTKLAEAVKKPYGDAK